MTEKQEKWLYIRAINGSKVTPEIRECYNKYLEFEESYDYYGWTWDIDKLSELPTTTLRGLYWAIHCDEL